MHTESFSKLAALFFSKRTQSERRENHAMSKMDLQKLEKSSKLMLTELLQKKMSSSKNKVQVHHTLVGLTLIQQLYQMFQHCSNKTGQWWFKSPGDGKHSVHSIKPRHREEQSTQQTSIIAENLLDKPAEQPNRVASVFLFRQLWSTCTAVSPLPAPIALARLSHWGWTLCANVPALSALCPSHSFALIPLFLAHKNTGQFGMMQGMRTTSRYAERGEREEETMSSVHIQGEGWFKFTHSSHSVRSFVKLLQ